jgi:tripartite-type tricarboxylate transporter receptor subunit TctC
MQASISSNSSRTPEAYTLLAAERVHHTGRAKIIHEEENMMGAGRTISVLLLALAPGAVAIAAAKPAVPEDYPDKPIRFLVPFAPGGANDFTARIIAQKLTERWGQQVVADNRPGAAGTIAVDMTAQSNPNGYTICLVSASHAVSAAVNPKLPYVLTRDLQAVAQIASLFYVLTLNPSVPAKSIKELIAHARANPGKLDYGSSGTFGLQHLAGEMFQHMARVNLVHVPYKGGSAALAEVVSGRIHMGFNTLVSARPHMEGGRLRVLGVTARKRSPAVPNVPTIEEAGLPGYEVDQWFGVVTAAKVPQKIVVKLSQAIADVLQDPEIARRMTSDGSTPVGSKPNEFSAHLKSEVAKWRKVAQDAGLRFQ